MQYFLNRKQKKPSQNLTTGFTLIEMLATIAIFIIVTSVVLSSYRKFGQGINTINLAYDIALSIREAQVYGITVKEVMPGSVNYNAGYGIDFTDAENSIHQINSYILFADLNNDLLYAGGNTIASCGDAIECLKFYKLSKDSKIEKFCGVLLDDSNINPVTDESGKDEECNINSTGANLNISSLDMVFTRPNPEASIISVYSGGSISLPGYYKSARIYISSYVGTVRRVVEVWGTGQIAVR